MVDDIRDEVIDRMKNDAQPNIPQKEYIHTTVLLHESIDGLGVKPGDIYLDGTLGSGGHAGYAAQKGTREKPVTMIGIDQDEEALARSRERLSRTVPKTGAKLFFIQESYRNLDKVLDGLNIEKADRIMLDLGLSSDQFETSGRGFSFQRNEPLLMTFSMPHGVSEATSPGTSPSNGYMLTAREIVNTWQEQNIADVIYGYGEERYARRIARAIVESRSERPIETTFDLVDVIKKATPSKYHHGKIHPATKTFQALRITVNDEIGVLKDGLTKGFDRLSAGGRMAVISFHSIEDRIVKNFFKEKASVEKNEMGQADAANAPAVVITKKPIVPGDQEILENPRARSAKLRIIEKK